MKRERFGYFAIEYFIFWNSALPKFSLEIANVLPSDVRYAERFQYYPRIAPCARYDYTDLHGFVMEQLWNISEVILGAETESGLRFAPSRQGFE